MSECNWYREWQLELDELRRRVLESEAESKKHHSNWLKALREATERNVEITLLENELKLLRAEVAQLEAENARLKAIVKAARMVVAEWALPGEPMMEAPIRHLREALAALEGGRCW